MFKIKSDITKNRLYVMVSGSPDEAELREIFHRIRYCVKGLKPGFNLVHDLTEYIPVSIKCAEIIKEIQTFLDSCGMKNVVRITNNQFSFMQLERTRQQCSLKYHVFRAYDEKEAFAILRGIS